MSKTTNDDLTWSGTGCFRAVPIIWQHWASKGLIANSRLTHWQLGFDAHNLYAHLVFFLVLSLQPNHNIRHGPYVVFSVGRLFLFYRYTLVLPCKLRSLCAVFIYGPEYRVTTLHHDRIPGRFAFPDISSEYFRGIDS